MILLFKSKIMPRFISFNINGIRARQHQLEAITDTLNPDIIGLQETKVHDEAFPLQDVKKLGYHVEFFGQKSHYGVALLSKQAPIFVQKGFLNATDEEQKRLIHARYIFDNQEIDVLNGYFPQGESRHHETKFPMKQAFYQRLTDYILELKQQNRNLIVMGDMNIAPQPIDIGIGEKNAKRWLSQGICSFLPEELAWYESLLNTGLHDTFRQLYPNDERLSWFDYRSKGFEDKPKRGLRIDHILCSTNLLPSLKNAGIAYELRAMEKPSDHTAVWADMFF